MLLGLGTKAYREMGASNEDDNSSEILHSPAYNWLYDASDKLCFSFPRLFRYLYISEEI